MACSSGRRVAIVGATRFIGGYLRLRLAREGNHCKIAAFSRSGSQKTVATGDLAGSVGWKYLLKNVDTVIHGAAIAHQSEADATGSPESRSRLYRVDRDAVASLTQARLDQ